MSDSSNTSPYALGREAFHAGEARVSPFDLYTDEDDEWCEGWQDAHDEEGNARDPYGKTTPF